MGYKGDFFGRTCGGELAEVVAGKLAVWVDVGYRSRAKSVGLGEVQAGVFGKD